MRLFPRRIRTATVVAALGLGLLSPVFAATNASAASAGQLCSSSKEGTKDGALTCTKDGTRFRWTASGAAPATTKAATTTKKPATTKPTATTKATATTVKGATKPAPAPAPASAPGQPVSGRFCAKASAGQKGKDNKGQTLTCKADASGKYRWTK
jgi:cytoskeletal protein RodZ